MHIFWLWRGGDQTIWNFCVPVPEFPLKSIWEREADRIGTETKIPPLALHPRRGQHRSVCLWRYSLHQTLPLSGPGIANGKNVFESRNHCTCIWESREDEKMGQGKGLFQTSQGSHPAGNWGKKWIRSAEALTLDLWDPFLPCSYYFIRFEN